VAAGAKEADRHGVAVLENEDQQEQQDDGEYRGTYPGGAGWSLLRLLDAYVALAARRRSV